MTAVINITMDKNKKASNFQALDHKHITRWKKKTELSFYNDRKSWPGIFNNNTIREGKWNYVIVLQCLSYILFSLLNI